MVLFIFQVLDTEQMLPGFSIGHIAHDVHSNSKRSSGLGATFTIVQKIAGLFNNLLSNFYGRVEYSYTIMTQTINSGALHIFKMRHFGQIVWVIVGLYIIRMMHFKTGMQWSLEVSIDQAVETNTSSASIVIFPSEVQIALTVDAGDNFRRTWMPDTIGAPAKRFALVTNNNAVIQDAQYTLVNEFKRIINIWVACIVSHARYYTPHGTMLAIAWVA